jgi:hypothetical protein
LDYLHSLFRKPLRVKVSVPGQAQKNLRELEASCLYGLGARADSRCNPAPGGIESLSERLQLIRAVGPARDKPTRLHDLHPPAKSSFSLPCRFVNRDRAESGRDSTWQQILPVPPTLGRPSQTAGRAAVVRKPP